MLLNTARARPRPEFWVLRALQALQASNLRWKELGNQGEELGGLNTYEQIRGFPMNDDNMDFMDRLKKGSVGKSDG